MKGLKYQKQTKRYKKSIHNIVTKKHTCSIDEKKSKGWAEIKETKGTWKELRGWNGEEKDGTKEENEEDTSFAAMASEGKETQLMQDTLLS